MSKLTLEDIRSLEKMVSDPSVTIIVPTNRLMPDRQKDPISVKNAMKEAADKLLAKYSKDQAIQLIEQLDELGQKVEYAKTLDCLVFLLNRDFSAIYYLPFKLNQKVTIDKTFDTQQLIRGFRQSPQYWVLAVSHKPARLFSCVKDSCVEMTESAEKEQKEIAFPFYWYYDVTSDRELLAVGTGDLSAKYLTERDREFMRDVDKRLDNFLFDNDYPLVLLGTIENISNFKEVSKHKDRVVGSREGDYSSAELNKVEKDALSVMSEYLKNEQKAVLNLIDEANSQKKLSTGIQDVLSIAKLGQVRLLVLEENAQFDLKLNQPLLGIEESDNLVDYLLDEVYAKDGKVAFVSEGELEHFGKVCAILRYR